MPIRFISYAKWNSYHAVYFGVLAELPKKDRIELTSIDGKPVLQDCINVSVFDAKDGERCLNNANARYRDVAKVILSHPSVIPKMIAASYRKGRLIYLHDLGKGMEGAPNFANLPIFNLTPPLFAHGYSLYAVVLMIAALCVLIQRRRTLLSEAERPFLKTGAFLALFGASQHVMVLADGFFDIEKHLTVGNYVLALSFAFMAPPLIMSVYRFFRPDTTRTLELPPRLPDKAF